jgi:hypothetical protein
MIDFLKLIILPSSFMDKLGVKKPSLFSIYTIWILAILTITLPNNIITFKTSTLGFAYIPIYIIVLFLIYFPIVYGFSYSYWIVGKGFKGEAKFIEIRNLFVFSLMPFILYMPIFLIFIIIGLVNSDYAMITHENYLTQVILWILSFRILITGIAKYNRFSWVIALVNWFIVILVIGGIYYLIKH